MTDVLTVVHECADFARWKAAFDAGASNRKAAGLTDLMLLRQQKKPSVVALVLGVDDRQKALAVIGSAAMRGAMQKGGVVGSPTFHLRHGEIRTPPASLYLSINCRIRDIDQFRKGFAMDKTDREAATLTDLGVLQDVEDPNDVLIVFSATDQAKVKAFLSLPALAEHQIRSAGVVSSVVVRYWEPA